MLTIRCESCVFCRSLESEHTGFCTSDLPESSVVYRESYVSRLWKCVINPCKGGQQKECFLALSLITGRSDSLKYLFSLHIKRTWKSIVVSEILYTSFSLRFGHYKSRQILSQKSMLSPKNQNCISRSKRTWYRTWPDQGNSQACCIPRTSYPSLLQNRQTPRPSDVSRNTEDSLPFVSTGLTCH